MMTEKKNDNQNIDDEYVTYDKYVELITPGVYYMDPDDKYEWWNDYREVDD